MGNSIYLRIILMILTLYAIRLTPFLFLRKEISNRFIRSFLYYVPYVTLAVMTFPAIVTSTDSMWSGILALIVGVIAAWQGGNLIIVAACCSIAVLLSGFIL